MITAALGFITSRKWAMELILAAVVAGLIWAGCAHLIQVGVEKERAVWVAKVNAANLETARLQGKADAAEKSAQGERNALNDYVANHPLHGGLCKPSGVPTATPAIAGHDGSSSTTAGVQSVPTGDSVGGQEVDQLGLLSDLAQVGDRLSAQVREWQAR